MFSRRRAPATVRDLLGPGERILTWGTAGPGRYVVVTNLGLWWPDVAPRLIPWHLIVRASWSEGGLAVVEADVDDDLMLVEHAPLVTRLDDQGKVPPVVRQRVEGSVARTHEVRVSTGSARVVGRRIAGRDGLAWWAHLSPGTADTRAVRVELAEIVGRLRAEDEARRAAL